MGVTRLNISLLLQFSIFQTRWPDNTPAGNRDVYDGPDPEPERFPQDCEGPKSYFRRCGLTISAHAPARPNFGEDASVIQPTDNWYGVGR